MNLLGEEDAWDNLIRIRSAQVRKNFWRSYWQKGLREILFYKRAHTYKRVYTKTNSGAAKMQNNKQNLERFLKAQELDYETALAEIKAGYKRSHWIWYIFPQIQGLGYSSMSQYYAIRDMEEARAYIEHPILGRRLIEISRALLQLLSNDAGDVMGYPDNMKLKSCMTLFSLAGDNDIFQKVLDKFFDGEKDKATIDILNK